MPKFGDAENKVMMVPEGDYVFCVIDFESKISSGGKTSGSDMYAVTLEIEPKGSRCFENLIDHPSTGWKLDCFLKSCGVKLGIGEGFEFNETLAKNNGVRFIDPMGLRGWCRLNVEEYPVGSGKKKNRVEVFYIDKPKLPARLIEQAEEERPF
jgi:hypothetical protein